ncbi:MAG: kelch repeat-containing protein, partial [Candidatus Poribacteria bacterium]
MVRTLVRNTLRVVVCLAATTHVLAAWEELEPLPTGPRSSLGVATVDGKIYVFGGIADIGDPNTLHEYDPEDDAWRRKADMLATAFAGGVAALGGKIYAVGIKDGVAVHAYDPATDTWRRRADLPSPRFGLECVTAGGKLYAIGGGPWGVEAPLDEYDPEDGTWTSKRSAPHQLWGFGAAVVDGRIFVTGGARLPGASPNARGIASALVYDPASDEWERLADMPVERERH